jgi:hypothetical protein
MSEAQSLTSCSCTKDNKGIICRYCQYEDILVRAVTNPELLYFHAFDFFDANPEQYKRFNDMLVKFDDEKKFNLNCLFCLL